MGLILLLLSMLNWERSQAGLHPLGEAQPLQVVSQAFTQDMVHRDYFAHTTPEGVSWWTQLEHINWQYYAAGQALAKTPDQRIDLAVQAWMHSPTHRDMVLNPLYNVVGLGVATDDDGLTVITATFSN